MLRFLSSLFTSADKPSGAVDRSLVEAGVERVVDATDPRLRAFPGYRKRLSPAVERSVSHIQGLIDGLPEPVEISRRSFSDDPRLRAFFSSPGRMQEAIAQAPSVVEYLENRRGHFPDYIYGLLAPRMSERKVLGMELQGDRVRRDVLQEVVDFSNYRFFGAAGSEVEAREGIKRRAFDFLAGLALKRILHLREKRSELERQKRLLQSKLDTMQAGNWGLEPMLAGEEAEHPDYRTLEQRIGTVEADLMKLPCSKNGLEQRIECINAVLERPEDGINLRQIELHLDAMSVKVEDPATADDPPVRLTEFYSSSGEKRVALFGYFPRDELPPEKDFFKEAGRYLGG